MVQRKHNPCLSFIVHLGARNPLFNSLGCAWQVMGTLQIIYEQIINIRLQ